MATEVKDLVIIGGGPAGLSAAVYGIRATLNELVIEKDIYGGGQIAVTDRVDNYLGLYGENGYDLSQKFRDHAEQLEVPFLEGEVASIKDGEVKEITLESGEVIRSKAVFISTGAKHKSLGVEGEERLTGAGVSYCATCDGAFFKGKKVAVVGGGDVALQDALYLANLCEQVYLIHRREEFRAAKVLHKRVLENDKITCILNSRVEAILGENKVEKLIVRDLEGHESQLEVSGIFVAIGMSPNTELVKNLLELSPEGYIVADESCRTSKKGFYAIGDVRTKQLRQVVTAVSDGAVAISSLELDS